MSGQPVKAIPSGVAEPPAPDTDAAAARLEDLYVEHSSFVWRCLRALGVPEAAVEDATQDVFLVVHRQLSTFRGESTVRTWLFAILRNVASNHRRSQHRNGARLSALRDDLTHPSAGPHERAQNAEAVAFVQQFLAQLDDKKRSVFILGVLEEMSMPEVAATLAIPLNTAYTRLRRVREDFQRALDARRGQP